LRLTELLKHRTVRPLGSLLLVASILWGGGLEWSPAPAALAELQTPSISEGDTTVATLEAVDAAIRGRLLLDSVPADTGTVVLHRVTPEEAGPVDSVQVGAGGAFALPLPSLPIPGGGEVYFASSRYEEILYFGGAVAQPTQVDSFYTIRTYSTRTAPPEGLPLTVEVRNIFIDQGPMGWRVTDLFQVRNDSARTWVGEGAEGIVWQHPLPTGARSVRVGQSDLSPDAVRFDDGGMQVLSPMPPGERLFVIQYELEALEFSLPLPGRTEIIEVLVDEAAPSLRMEGLTAAQPVEMEPGSLYRRWAAEGVEGRTVRVAPGEESASSILPWVGVGLGFLLLGLGVWAVRRRPPARDPGREADPRPSDPSPAADQKASASPAPVRRRILLEIAELDEVFAGISDPSEEDRRRYETQRSELLRRLNEGAGKGGEERSSRAGPSEPGP
jgi:hypothetical protein